MELLVKDKVIVFMKWKIEFSSIENREDKDEIMKTGSSNILWTTLYAETDEQKNSIEAMLTSKGISFTTTDISPTQAQLDKKAELDGKIASRSEVLEQMPS